MILSHEGYEEDIALARSIKNVDLIIGGHSHSLLGDPQHLGELPIRGTYPTKIGNTLIVQAWEWGKALGKITLHFDTNGHVIRYETPGPILVESSIPEDPLVRSMLATFERPLHQLKTQKVGEAAESIARGPEMGYVLADGMLNATRKMGAVAAFINAGGVRSSFEVGPITYGQAIEVQPFNNTLVVRGFWTLWRSGRVGVCSIPPRILLTESTIERFPT